EYQLVCPSDFRTVEFAREQYMQLGTAPGRLVSWPLCSDSFIFAQLKGEWVRYEASDALKQLHRAYATDPHLPEQFEPQSSFNVIPRRGSIYSDYGLSD